jgi:hypothetical protein
MEVPMSVPMRLAALGALCLALLGCAEKKDTFQKAGQKVDEAVYETGKATKKATDATVKATKKAVDATGKALENAGEKMQGKDAPAETPPPK